jgi:hypothetical protein
MPKLEPNMCKINTFICTSFLDKWYNNLHQICSSGRRGSRERERDRKGGQTCEGGNCWPTVLWPAYSIPVVNLPAFAVTTSERQPAAISLSLPWPSARRRHGRPHAAVNGHRHRPSSPWPLPSPPVAVLAAQHRYPLEAAIPHHGVYHGWAGVGLVAARVGRRWLGRRDMEGIGGERHGRRLGKAAGAWVWGLG